MIRNSLLVVLAFAVVGCSPPRLTREESAPPSAEAHAVPLPSMPALDGSGGLVELSAFKGQVMLLDFWATWCPPCRAEIPVLSKLHAEYRDRGFSVIGMTVDEGSVEHVSKAVEPFALSYPVGLADADVQAAYGGIRVVPTKYLVDRDGHVRRYYQGMVRESVLREDVETLLNLPAGEERDG